MTIGPESTLREVALAVGAALARARIRAVLTGGACASLYSDGRYLSQDLDFVLEGRVTVAALDAAMGTIGFTRRATRFVHARSPFWVEFPRGPLAVGADLDVEPIALEGGEPGTLALSPTDSCRDRLAAFFHWSDRQSLAVAVEIAARSHIDLERVRRWSEREGQGDRFREFQRRLEAKRRG